MSWRPDVCLFHGPGCLDGHGAAFAVWQKWGDSVEYIPCSYGGELPEIFDRCTGKNALIVDFSFKHFAMVELGKLVKSCIVLDHHASAQKELEEWRVSIAASRMRAFAEGIEYDKDHLPIRAVFDMEKSGARLAWEFCNPDELPPAWVVFIEDRDLWRFQFGDLTRQFNAALRSYPQTFDAWTNILDRTRSLSEEGAHILRAHIRVVSDLCRNAYEDEIAGYRVPVLNVPYPYVSDCGHELLKLYPDAPFSACWSRSGDKFKFSLRSEDSRTDVSKIAEQFQGGGHRNAAGYEVAA